MFFDLNKTISLFKSYYIDNRLTKTVIVLLIIVRHKCLFIAEYAGINAILATVKDNDSNRWKYHPT